jgi:hypothetical protein
MTRLTYFAEWRGEPQAGIMAGTNEVTIEFKYDQPLDAELVEYWRESIAEFYDGATVELIESENQRT